MLLFLCYAYITITHTRKKSDTDVQSCCTCAHSQNRCETVSISILHNSHRAEPTILHNKQYAGFQVDIEIYKDKLSQSGNMILSSDITNMFITLYSNITPFGAFEISYIWKYHVFENIMENGEFALLEPMLHFPQYFQKYSKLNLKFS